MARSLASLTKRTKTIKTTQKITNAMKLVSISKLQRYIALHIESSNVFDKLKLINYEEYESKKQTLYVVVFPDMGLASNFSKQLIAYLQDKGTGNLLVVGLQGYENLKEMGFNIVNERISSEQISLYQLQEMVDIYQEQYQMMMLVPRFYSESELKITEFNTNVSLVNVYNQIYEPSYEIANRSFYTMYAKGLVIEGYYLSKITEYTIRRIAMEKATESADSMLHDLALQYNRLRQERITEEIADLMSEED
jgi:F-type H+-transporting ATPase subunit gamma